MAAVGWSGFFIMMNMGTLHIYFCTLDASNIFAAENCSPTKTASIC